MKVLPHANEGRIEIIELSMQEHYFLFDALDRLKHIIRAPEEGK